MINHTKQNKKRILLFKELNDGIIDIVITPHYWVNIIIGSPF